MRRHFFSCVMVVALLGGCNHKEVVQSDAEEIEIAVEAMEVQHECVADTLRVIGEVRATDQVTVYAKVAGKLIDYDVSKGDLVQKGDLLARIDRDEVGYKFNEAPVYSPMSGMITKTYLDCGGEVRGDSAVANVTKIDRVKVVFQVPQRYRDQLKVGQSVELNINTKKYSTKITQMTPLIDPVTRSFRIDTKLDNPERKLLPGMFATGEVVLKEYKQSVMLPEEAIVPINGQWHVFLMQDQRAVLAPIKLGLRKLGRVQIVEGVEVGDQVILAGNHKVLAGQKVVLLEEGV